ncbi:MAG: hypothetical protein NVSMB62_07680 [Acidobacteriaceae bacterium]
MAANQQVLSSWKALKRIASGIALSLWLIPIVACGPKGILTATAPADKVAPVPSITPASGTYAGLQSITMADSIAGAGIYYTIDGSTPTLGSSLYTQPFTIKANATVKAIATAAGYTSSDVTSVVYSIVSSQAAAPTLLPVAGAYTGAQSVTLADATAGSSIYYTVDGSAPTIASTLYTVPITVSATETISAIAIAPGAGTSPIATGVYTIHAPQAAAPTFSPGPGMYTGSQFITITEATTGANIYYTTDGTTPTQLSTLYTGPIKIFSSETVSAIGGGSAFTSSPVASATYSISIPALSSPVFSPAGGTYAGSQIVTVTDTVPNAVIYYTTDGSIPTASAQQYTGPITISSSQTLTAVAVATGYTNSAPMRATYSISASGSPGTTTYTFSNAQIAGGGFVDGIVMHPAQQGLMYARTDVGGAYRWDISTKQWIPLTDFVTRDQANYLGIESIGVDPKDPNKLYLAVGTYADWFGTNGAILISNDQGRSFTTVTVSFKLGSNDAGRFAGERLSVDPNLSSHLYFGSRLNGLWESKDSGTTWVQVTSFPITGSSTGDPSTSGGVIFEDFIAASGGTGQATPTVYVGVDDNTVSALYLTHDGGKSWASVAGQPTGLFLNRGVAGPDGNLYLSYSNALGPAGATAGAIWRYTLPTSASPTGVWKKITPLPSFPYNASSIGYGSIAVDPQRPGVIMATTLDLYYQHDDVFRSLDGGNSWIDLGGNQIRDSSLSPWVNFGQSTPGIGNWLVAMAIDPYDSNHVLYGTGQTLWQTTNATAADATPTAAGTTTSGSVPTSWSIGAAGIEECVVLSLISPPSGASVLSGVRDIGGFTHTSLTASPAGGMQTHPLFFDTTSMDFAQSLPGKIVRVGDGAANNQNGAYSADGGTSWTPFISQGGSTAGGGSVAIAADGSVIVWAPSDVGVLYSKDNGATWTASFGLPGKLPVIADRVNAMKFYSYDSSSGILYRSVDGGNSFTQAATSLPTGGVLRASYAAAGDLWLATLSGLQHSTDSGTTFSAVVNTQQAYDVTFGKPATGAAYPTIFLYGRLSGVQGVYRSTNAGSSWVAVTDSAHQYGSLNVIAADPKVFGRIYLGTGGRGVVYADSAQ